MGCAVGTVKSQCARGLATLRAALDDAIPANVELQEVRP
jgi:DNA-directed RNA polymerase specialized sigma24 family protein